MVRGRTRRKRDILSLPTYVINLNERKDRWKRFLSQPAATTFRRLRRFPAVNGKRLNYRNDKRISVRTRLNITRNYRRSHYEIATLGAVGSSMSHVGVWRKFVASGAPKCLVLEDDVILTDDQLRSINDVTGVPDDYGVWILGCYLPNLIIQTLGKGAWSRVYNFTAAHAYILTRKAAIKLLEEPFPVENHIEYYMTAASILKDFKIVHNNDIHLEFFRKPSGPRTADSNTSQHKGTGCPSCNVPDDFSQLYRGFSRKTQNGMRIMGVIDSPQPKKLLTFKNTGAGDGMNA